MSALALDAKSGALTRLRRDLACRETSTWPRGVVGAHAADGSALYAYPEIAGYWLQWASRREDVSSEHGEAVLDWLQRAWLPEGGWPTRVGGSGHDPAYRRADYLYDHAILWHGLREWALQRHAHRAVALADAAWEAAGRYLVDGRLVAGRGALPARWSGCGGPFLLKACARLRSGRGALAQAAAAAIPALAALTLAAPHAEAHPQLYAIEGLLLVGQAAAARQALEALLAAHGGAARLCESLDGGARRSDVLAQALRAALLLGLPRSDDWAELAGELAARVDAHGRLPFVPFADARPTWAALFAEQALGLWCGDALVVEDLV